MRNKIIFWRFKRTDSSSFKKKDYPDYDSQNDVKDLYLNLLRNTVQNSIYPESENKALNRGYPLYAHTMLPKYKLDTIRYCIEYCLKNKIEGDIIETGVWRGGATIFMEGVLCANNALDRKLYVADSFEGLPKPSMKEDKGDTHYSKKMLSVSLDTVKDNFRKYNLLKDNVVFIKGYFETTMKNINIDKLAVLRLDGDMYSSTIVVLDNLYDRVSSGGFVIIDDWKLRAAQKAAVDFRKKNNIEEPLFNDASGVFWQKK